QASGGDTLVVVGVPAVERERANAWSIRLRQEFCGSAGRFGKIGLRRPRTAGLLRHVLLSRVPGMLDRCQLDVVRERGREFFIGMLIKIEQALHRIGARRLYALGRPRQDRRGAAYHERRHWTDSERLAALRVDAAAGSKSGQCAIEPAAVADRGLGEAAFEQILAIEMRAFAIGRGASVNDDRLIGLEQPM